ncbi:MAG: OmpA family protein [Terracidiphilus sp.]
MKLIRSYVTRISSQAVSGVLLAGMLSATVVSAQQFTAGDKGKVKGEIVSRNGNEVKVQDAKSGDLAIVLVTDDTYVLRDKGSALLRRQQNMDVTAMVPGLTITVDGVGNASGQLVARKINFSPDDFAIAVAQQQQIIGNGAAASAAQKTANQGVTAAGAAQTSADQAQSSASQANATAVAAGSAAAASIGAVQLVNKRVSDLDDYKTVSQAVIYYPTGKSTLDDAGKADLDKLAALALSTDGYLIEIAGYASKPGTKDFNQQLSEDRANTVANYLRNTGNIPIRRIVAPAGYGATHPDAVNEGAKGRELNQRVEVKLIVNKGIQKDL